MNSRDLKADLARLAKDQRDKDLSDEFLLQECGVQTRRKLLNADRLGLELRYGVTFVESNIAKEWLTRAIQAEKQVADLENQIDVLSTTLNMYCSPYYEIKERAEKVEALAQELVEALEMAFDLLEHHQPNWYIWAHFHQINNALGSYKEAMGDE